MYHNSSTFFNCTFADNTATNYGGALRTSGGTHTLTNCIFYGNNGYTFIKCEIEKAKLDKIDYKKIKNSTMNKYFLIYSEKLLKRLNKEANIKIIEKIFIHG